MAGRKEVDLYPGIKSCDVYNRSFPGPLKERLTCCCSSNFHSNAVVARQRPLNQGLLEAYRPIGYNYVINNNSYIYIYI